MCTKEIALFDFFKLNLIKIDKRKQAAIKKLIPDRAEEYLLGFDIKMIPIDNNW